MMDARRNQAYYGIYDVSSVPKAIAEQAAAPVSEVVDRLNAIGRDVIFVGDGVPVFADYLAENVRVPYRLGTDAVRYQRASSVVSLGRKYWEQGKVLSAAEFAPIYLRLSQAERERMENITTGKAQETHV
jgi:tRNA threonylcarbamoyladenosine biosynthesis protein TsaB